MSKEPPMLFDIKSFQRELSASAGVKDNLAALSAFEGTMKRNAVGPLAAWLQTVARAMFDALTIAPPQTALRVVKPYGKSFEDDAIASLQEDVIGMLGVADNLAALSDGEGTMKRSVLAPLVAQLSTLIQTMEDALCALLPPEKACA
jgi:hypothetical protein